MPYKCCVPKCKSNYASEKRKKKEKVPVYRFPKDNVQKQLWVRTIPRANLIVNNNTRVCRYHWPPEYSTFVLERGKERPTEPPSIFDVPVSDLPTPAPKPRATKLSSSALRNTGSSAVIPPT